MLEVFGKMTGWTKRIFDWLEACFLYDLSVCW
jgi:hypothetical protein